MLKHLPERIDWDKLAQNKTVYLCMSLGGGVETVVADVIIISDSYRKTVTKTTKCLAQGPLCMYKLK
jgi:hypothetical protein